MIFSNSGGVITRGFGEDSRVITRGFGGDDKRGDAIGKVAKEIVKFRDYHVVIPIEFIEESRRKIKTGINMLEEHRYPIQIGIRFLQDYELNVYTKVINKKIKTMKNLLDLI